jgi:hypothetical protein
MMIGRGVIECEVRSVKVVDVGDVISENSSEGQKKRDDKLISRLDLSQFTCSLYMSRRILGNFLRIIFIDFPQQAMLM